MAGVSWERPGAGSGAKGRGKKAPQGTLDRRAKVIFALAILAGIIVLVFAVCQMAQAADTNEGKKLHEARLAEWKAKGWGDPKSRAAVLR